MCIGFCEASIIQQNQLYIIFILFCFVLFIIITVIHNFSFFLLLLLLLSTRHASNAQIYIFNNYSYLIVRQFRITSLVGCFFCCVLLPHFFHFKKLFCTKIKNKKKTENLKQILYITFDVWMHQNNTQHSNWK